MRKTRLSFLLPIILIIGILTPVASAATFSDIEDHWSESYVEDVYALGLINGYDDGTFLPDKSMNYYEALLFCSRVSGLSDDTKTEIAALWYDDMMALLPDSIASWAYAELAICVEMEILSIEELTDLCDSDLLTSTITREALCLYLCRTIQLDGLAESYTSYDMSFYDTDSIDDDYLPYVYLLTNYGIILGDTEGNFSPQNTLTRAAMATMLSRTIELIDSEGLVIRLPSDVDYSSWLGGTLIDVSSSQIEVYGLDGILYTYPLSDDMILMVNGIQYTYLSSSLEDYFISFTLSEEDGEVTEITMDTSVQMVQGVITGYGSVDDPTITLTDLEEGTATSYDLAYNATIVYDGWEVEFDDLETGWYGALLFDDDDQAYTLWCSPSSTYLSGTLTSISYDLVTTITISLSDGSTMSYGLDITDLPTILRDSSTSAIEKLSVGDFLVVEMEYGIISEISATSQRSDLTGTISAVSKGADGTTITVVLDSGSTEAYFLSSGVVVTCDSATLSSGDLEYGDQVSLVVSDGYVTAIDIEVTSSAGTQMIYAKIISTDSTEKTFSVTIEGNTSTLVTIDTSNASLCNSYNTTIYFTNFDPDEYIYAWGSYTSGIFYATMIILEL